MRRREEIKRNAYSPPRSCGNRSSQTLPSGFTVPRIPEDQPMPTRVKFRHIVIIDGHPDPSSDRYLHALATAYADGARTAGHAVTLIEVAKLRFPLLQTADEFEKGSAPDVILKAQELVRQADHIVILYPLWLGSMPALLKGFIEQLLRPGFAFAYSAKGLPKKLLAGKSAHVIVTMGMPGFFYRWYYRAHSLKSLERNILNFVGIKPVRSTVIGMIGVKNSAKRKEWLTKLAAMGRDTR
jgi:putative NADPH-quinone reductase